jgi:hypothetical protein
MVAALVVAEAPEVAIIGTCGNIKSRIAATTSVHFPSDLGLETWMCMFLLLQQKRSKLLKHKVPFQIIFVCLPPLASATLEVSRRPAD